MFDKPWVLKPADMPLPEPAARQAIHSRTVSCEGFQRDDGLWDIDARMVDTKTYGFPNHDRGRIEAGEALHDIRLRLTLDERYLIHEVQASIDDSPFHVCSAAVGGMRQLIGLRIEKGWMREVRRRVGGTRGCTHLIELLGPLATTAFQTMHKQRSEGSPKVESQTKPVILDTCHALASDGPVVKRQWPDFYTGPDSQKND